LKIFKESHKDFFEKLYTERDTNILKPRLDIIYIIVPENRLFLGIPYKDVIDFMECTEKRFLGY
jgi:hypothetical protein